MITVLAVMLSAAIYAYGYLRVRRRGRAFPVWAVVAFGGGLAVVLGTLVGPLDDLSDASLAWHMMQHLALITLAAPLLLLGAPVRLTLAALPPYGAARLSACLQTWPLRLLDRPAFGLAALTVALYGTHFSPMYEAALQNEGVHAVEHALYLAAALSFWSPILAVAPAPHAATHPARILVLFLSIPMTAFLGFAFYTMHRVVYPHYAVRPHALQDQMNAGAIMWLAAGTPVLLALLWCVADWGARETRLGRAFDHAGES